MTETPDDRQHATREQQPRVRGVVECLHPLRIRGWAFGIDGENLALSARIDGAEWPLPGEWYTRRDVADVHGEAALHSGFTGHPGVQLALALRSAQLEGRHPEILCNGETLGFTVRPGSDSHWHSEADLAPLVRACLSRLELLVSDESLFGLPGYLRAAQAPGGDASLLPTVVSELQKRYDTGNEAFVSEVIDALAREGAFHVLPVELAIIRASMPIATNGGVNGEILEAAFLHLHHEASELGRPRVDPEALRDGLTGLLARLAVRRALAQPDVADAERYRALRVSLARWVDRLAQAPQIALDFMDLLEATPAAGREAELLLRARMDIATGRTARALGTLADLLAAGSSDGYVHHQSAVLAHTFLAPRLWLARHHLPALVNRFARASALNPEQCQSKRDACHAVTEFARAAIAASADRARRGDLDLAVSARAGDMRLACTQMLRAVGIDANPPPRGAWRRCSRRRVLFWGSKGLFQCYQYRVVQKFEQAGSLDLETDFLDLAEFAAGPPEAPDWRRRLMGAAVLYACRVPATPEYLPVFAYARALGIPVIYDIDDLIFDAEVFPPPLHTYAGTIDEGTHRHLRLDNPFFLEGLRFADHVTVSTPALAREVARHLDASVPVTVLPNLLDESLAAEARAKQRNAERADTDVVIFYGSATKAHKESFYRVFLPAALDVLARHPSARLELVGFFSDLPDELLLSGRIRVEPPTADFAAYLARLRKADISISVLEDSRSTDVKSEIKWLEAAVYGIPSVVSPTAAYREALSDGRNVLFARDAAAWSMQLGRLVEDPALRVRIGEAARAHALERFGPEQGTRILGDVLAPLLPPQQDPPRKGMNILARVLEPLRPAPQTRTRKRVLLANVYYHPQSIGGATRVVEAQVRGLRERMAEEFEVFVLTTNNDPDPKRPHGVTQYWHEGVLVTALEIPRREWSLAEDATVEDVCRDFLKTYRIELVHAHCIQMLTSSVLLAARALGIPYIVTVHDGWWLSRFLFLVDDKGEVVDHRDPLSGGTIGVGERPKLVARAQRLRSVLRGAERLLAVSATFAEVYREAGFPRMEVHENFAVLPDLLQGARTARDPDGRIVLGFIGGISRHKGYHLVQRAIEEGGFRNLALLVVDHGLRPGEHYRIAWGETPVEFISRHHQSDVAGLYARLDVLLAPSIWPESFGLVTREAIHAGVWVIASDRGAIGDCVEEGVNGNVVSVEDHRPLMQAIHRLPEALARRDSRGSSPPTTPGASLERHLAELQKTYRDVLAD